ncbi:MAG: hypothetical protein H6581_05330 [Bacteroidia bacterium]|nr:hypothetical protein [Bacteroidia bacterium]
MRKDEKLIFIHLGPITTRQNPPLVLLNLKSQTQIHIRPTSLQVPFGKTDHSKILSKNLVHDPAQNVQILLSPAQLQRESIYLEGFDRLFWSIPFPFPANWSNTSAASNGAIPKVWCSITRPAGALF